MPKLRLTTAGGTTVEIETDEGTVELVLAQALRAIEGAAAPEEAEQVEITPDLLRAIWHSLRKEQHREYLRLLASEQGGLDDDALKLRLGIDADKSLSGINGGLSKWAKKHGITLDDIVVQTIQVRPDGKRQYLYRIRPMMRHVLEETGELVEPDEKRDPDSEAGVPLPA